MNWSNFAIDQRQRKEQKELDELFNSLSKVPLEILFVIFEACDRARAGDCSITRSNHQEFDRLANVVEAVINDISCKAYDVVNKIKERSDFK